jgi:hypothetical protein
VANFYETQEDESQAEDLTQEPQDTTIEETTLAEPQAAPEVQEEETPSKYKGKSVAEIIKMHQEAEKLIGKHAQEVGEVRKLADELIKRQLDTPTKEEVKATEEDEIDFFADPEKAVNKKIDKHPAIQEAKQQTLQLKQMQTMNRLQQDFPNFMQTVADPEFVEWIKGSTVRIQLFNQANANYDFDSAAELLQTWNYVKPKAAPRQEAPQEVRQAQRAAIQQATVDVGGTSQNVNSTKVFRRADLIRLQIQDPDRYAAMQDDIMAAYAEGRVK